MRTLSILLGLFLVAGCTTFYRSDTQPRESFETDLAACGGSTRSGPFIVPLIAIPLIVGAMIADREMEKSCMAQRGWQVVEDPAPPHYRTTD